MCSKTHYYYYYSYFCSFFLVVSNLLNLNMSSTGPGSLPTLWSGNRDTFSKWTFWGYFIARIPDGVDKEFKFVHMTITGALEQTLWKAFAFQRLRARTQNVILLKRDRVCRRRHAKTKETRRYGADENRSVLEKNRTEPVKNRGAEKKYLCFIFTDIFFDARPLFLNIGLAATLSGLFLYVCWRRSSIPVGGGETGSEMLPDRSRRSDWGGSSRVEGLYIPARKVPEPGEKRWRRFQKYRSWIRMRKKGEIASGESRIVASDFPGEGGER